MTVDEDQQGEQGEAGQEKGVAGDRLSQLASGVIAADQARDALDDGGQERGETSRSDAEQHVDEADGVLDRSREGLVLETIREQAET